MNEGFSWVSKCIASSTNAFHIECCRVLVQLFSAQYDDKELSDLLEYHLREKAIELMVEV
jgi:hypothetical protein